MQRVVIAAVAQNGVIGDGQEIPWSIPEDWDRFRSLTTGNFVIMGRATYEAIGDPLPNRTTIVLTSNPDEFEVPAPQGRTRVVVAPDFEQAYRLAITARGSVADSIVYVAGGGQVYQEAIDKVDALDITWVKKDASGDVRFPEIDQDKWLEVRRQEHPTHDYVKYVPRSFTDRLTLVPATVADAEDWARLFSRPDVAELAPERELESVEGARRYLQLVQEDWDQHSLDLWTIRLTETGEFIGVGGLNKVTLENGDKVWLLEYQLVPEQQGNGYTPEMVTKAFERVRRIDREARVRALIAPRNVKSMAIAEEAGLKRIEERTNSHGEPVFLYQGWVRQLLG